MAPSTENPSTDPTGPRRRPSSRGGPGGPLRDRFRDSIRDALSDVDVDALQGRTGAPVNVRDAVSAIEAEVGRLRAERAELQGRAANGTSRPWSPGRAMDPLEGEGSGGAPEAVAPRSPAPGAAPPAPVTVSGSGGVASKPPAQRPGGAGTTAAAATTASAGAAGTTALQSPKRTQRFPRLPRLTREAQEPNTLSDAELEAVVAPLLAEVQSLREEVEQLRGPLPDLTTPAARNRNLMLLAVGVLVGFALIVIALAVVLKA